MASVRPEIPDGFLGAQPRFSELKLHTDSHKDAEFAVKGANNVVIKLKCDEPVKVATKFTAASDTDLTDFVLVQRGNERSVQFHLGFTENGWYKFLIFALEESNPSDSLPNVYNYLIQVSDIKKPAQSYVKPFTKFYQDCCILEEPLTLNSNSENLDKISFKIFVPEAEKVAVHCVQEWFHLAKTGARWEGTADLSKYKGKDSKVKVMANYDKEGCTFNALLEYTI